MGGGGGLIVLLAVLIGVAFRIVVAWSYACGRQSAHPSRASWWSAGCGDFFAMALCLCMPVCWPQAGKCLPVAGVCVHTLIWNRCVRESALSLENFTCVSFALAGVRRDNERPKDYFCVCVGQKFEWRRWRLRWREYHIQNAGCTAARYMFSGRKIIII